MMSQGSTLASQIQSGDAEGARRTAENFDSVAKKLEANVTSPLWAPLVFVPVYGEDVRSVRNLSRVASRLSTDVLVPLTRNLPTDGSARVFVDGAINIPVVQVMLNSIANGATTIQECAYYVGEMPERHGYSRWLVDMRGVLGGSLARLVGSERIPNLHARCLWRIRAQVDGRLSGIDGRHACRERQARCQRDERPCVAAHGSRRWRHSIPDRGADSLW